MTICDKILPMTTVASDRNPWEVVAVAYDGLCTFEFGVVVEVFGLPRPDLEPWYQLRVAGIEPGPLKAAGGIEVRVAGGIRLLDRAGTIIIPGWRDPDETPPATLIRSLQRAHFAGARILSVCSGVFVLAAAGLLDDRRATTHWRYAEKLAARYPKIEVDPDVLYVDSGNVLTSAGSAAGIDLCLHLIRRDCGTAVANRVARRLVVAPHRAGGQQQFIESPVASEGDGSLAPLLDTIRREIARAHTVESMANRARMSPRTFARRFVEATGSTPHRWLIGERVRQAQGLLETTDLPVDRVSDACGFADSQSLRLHFKRLVGSPPATYRRAFRR